MIIEGIDCSWYEQCVYYKALMIKGKELDEYKASKQASYETMQTECNNAILENRELKKVLKEVVAIAKEYNYWDANLRTASDVIYQIKDKCSEVLNEGNI